jgi:hypothetical protein
MPRASCTHCCPHCPASYPTRRGLSHHLTNSNSCLEKSLESWNAGLGKRTHRRCATAPEDKPSSAAEPGPFHEHHSPDAQPIPAHGVQHNSENAPENKPVIADNDIIDISDNNEDWLSAAGMVAEEAVMDVDQEDTVNKQIRQASNDTEPAGQEYIPYEPLLYFLFRVLPKD